MKELLWLTGRERPMEITVNGRRTGSFGRQGASIGVSSTASVWGASLCGAAAGWRFNAQRSPDQIWRSTGVWGCTAVWDPNLVSRSTAPRHGATVWARNYAATGAGFIHTEPTAIPGDAR